MTAACRNKDAENVRRKVLRKDTDMDLYTHKVQYYETDRMGITHHSNYIRWMEEARMDLLDRMGWGYNKLEEAGVGSPVLSVNCRYKHATTYGDTVGIRVWVQEFGGVRLTLGYEMKNMENGELVLEGTTEHCFLGKDMRPVRLKKLLPEFYEKLCSYCQNAPVPQGK